MEQFPHLEKWFDIRASSSGKHKYQRYDLCLKEYSKGAIDSLTDELSLVIARLRLSKQEYGEWLKYWKNKHSIPTTWKHRFRDAFSYSFVSQFGDDMNEITFDETGLQGYIGELILYLIQLQYDTQHLDASPRKPKPYAKDSGIDCLEIGGDPDKQGSLHYIVWECKATTSDDPGGYPSKIYSQHLNEIGKSFREKVDFFDDIYADDPVLGNFVKEMIDDFYATTPSTRKRYGGCVTLSTVQRPSANAFAHFADKFSGVLAEDSRCRQVRFCSIGDISEVVEKVRYKIWNKLHP